MRRENTLPDRVQETECGVKREHLSGYQARDYEVVDYRMFELDDTGLSFRGPRPEGLESGNYFTCLGAAQTLGCFCEEPFPCLISKKLGIPALNLGYGGAGPEFFARNESLDDYINGGKFVVLQVMSGRSQSNSMFETRGLEYMVRRSDGAVLGADEAYRDLIYGPRFLRRRPFRWVTRRLAPFITERKVRRVVGETRLAWIESHRALLARLEVPTVFFWFSKRHPAYAESFKNRTTLFGEFPQLVNPEMVAAVRELCDHYVECVTDRGSPQPLVSRFSGERVTADPALDRPDFGGELWTHNFYYPSPEMHHDAAEALVPVCERIVS